MSSESVWSQLRRLIADGTSAIDASEVVMRDLPKRWRDWARPFVFRAARDLEGKVVNRTLRTAVGAAGRRNRAAAIARLHTTVYRLPDGTRVVWDDMTVDMIELKIALLRKNIGSLVDHLHILEAARKLCADHGVTRLGDIADWPSLLAGLVPDASAEAVTEPSLGAREVTTSGDASTDVADNQESAAAA